MSDKTSRSIFQYFTTILFGLELTYWYSKNMAMIPEKKEKTLPRRMKYQAWMLFFMLSGLGRVKIWKNTAK